MILVCCNCLAATTRELTKYLEYIKWATELYEDFLFYANNTGAAFVKTRQGKCQLILMCGSSFVIFFLWYLRIL